MDYSVTSLLLLLLLCYVSAEDDVDQEPRMLSKPSNLKIIEGSSVLLPCNVLNIGESNVRIWRKLPHRMLFSGSIAVSSDLKISLVDKSSLHIENITSEYSGEYMCSFFNKPHLKVIHKLLVLVPPSVTTVPPHGKVIERRGSLTMMACHASGVPKPSITWTYEENGSQMTSLPSGVSLVHEYQLEVESVDSHQAGLYRCTAENEVGSPAIATFNFTVLYAPELVVRPDWSHADEGATVEFTCICNSAPLSQMVWVQGDPRQKLYLEANDRIKIKERITSVNTKELSFRIQRMRREDLGKYTCIAKNAVGETRKMVEISGLAEPVQLRGNASGEDSVLLLWTTKSYSSIIEYQMKIRKYKDGDEWTDVMIPVEGTQHTYYSQSYNVTGLEPGQRYEIVLQALNDFGWNRPSDSFYFGPSLEMTEEIDIENVMQTTLPLQDFDSETTDIAFLNTGSLSIKTRNLVFVLSFLLIMLL